VSVFGDPTWCQSGLTYSQSSFAAC